MNKNNLGTIISNGTMHAFVLHNTSGNHGIESTDLLITTLRTEAKTALKSILDMGEDLAGMGHQMIKHAINVECNAAAARTIKALSPAS